MEELETEGLDHIEIEGPEGRIALARELLRDAHRELSDRNELGVAVLTDSALSSVTKADRMLEMRQHDAGRVVAKAVREEGDDLVDTIEEPDDE